ncbi:MAG: hypothetical protein K2J89_03835 [Clostridia bacterium]|nr:hypothetical protein [Clostridia bacterium]
MGAWSVKLSSNDDFTDITKMFFDYYFYDTISIEEIEEKIIEISSYSVLDSREWHNVYFALADCEWKCGYFNKDIFSKAEEIIQSGRDLEYWKELGATPYVLQKRQAVLSDFLEKIKSENTKPVKRVLKERFVFPLKRGDVFTYYSKPSKVWGCGVVLEVRESQLQIWEEEYHFYALLAISELNGAYAPIVNQILESDVKDIFWDGGCSYTLPKRDILVIGNVADIIDENYTNYFGSVQEGESICWREASRPKFEDMISPNKKYKAENKFLVPNKPMRFYFDKNNLRTTQEILNKRRR